MTRAVRPVVRDLPVPAPSAQELHHGSHTHLLSFLPAALVDRTDTPDRGGEPDQPSHDSPGHGCLPERVERRIDAIVVPTFRPHHALRDAMAAAQELGCRLVALCSGPAQAWRAVELGDEFGVDVIAVDLHENRPDMPRFRSDEVLARNGFVHGSDLSLKRNLGLLLGRMIGWSRVLFLDDDIAKLRAVELNGAARHLDSGEFRAVGLQNTGYPDNSVVCHAYRAVGGVQDSFIGGGAMIVDPTQTRSFFPNIYNEDWFFLLGDGVPFKAAVSGSMYQRSYDPFASAGRATGEELGDTLAEGLFWLLDGGSQPKSGDAGFWGDFLSRRQGLLSYVLDRLDDHVDDPPRRELMKASLRAARARSLDINPWLCASFVGAWREDLVTWGRFLSQRSSCLDDPEKALAELGLSHVAMRTAQS
ncbi:hypothetical protein JIG36_47155 [Actinoplanes sp. LDG1-06]|uniref:Uncharacterized protein n=1 Tax=Paractinoplanes ovalisporus TaxID=2810368 RepID=A0ABS2ATD3_9ACTN|nr:hypothetical protein [Actinoplanes ovalisporus]MBM2623105.1 hypothetical protein [Actinoplanes ovalisporus]